MQWLDRLLKRNRGEGPKPSGISLWKDIHLVDQLAVALTDAAAVGHEYSWDELLRELGQVKQVPGIQ